MKLNARTVAQKSLFPSGISGKEYVLDYLYRCCFLICTINVKDNCLCVHVMWVLCTITRTKMSKGLLGEGTNSFEQLYIQVNNLLSKKLQKQSFS